VIDYGWRSGQDRLPDCGNGGFRRCRSTAKPSRHTVKAWRTDVADVACMLPSRDDNDHIESCGRLEIASQ
jgi:hypothetical protein